MTAHLMKVYAPSGEMFEVIPQIAESLIVEKGWSITPGRKPEDAFRPAQPAAPKSDPVEEPAAPPAPAAEFGEHFEVFTVTHPPRPHRSKR